MTRNSIVPNRPAPILDLPFGDSARGCYVLQHYVGGLHFPVHPSHVAPSKARDDSDHINWAYGSIKEPLIGRRYSELMRAQEMYAYQVARGSGMHTSYLMALARHDLSKIPSRIGVEATVVFQDDHGDNFFIKGWVNDMGMNLMGCPIPYAAFAGEITSKRTTEALIHTAVSDMLEKQLGLYGVGADRVKIHSVYTLARRLRTQISCLVDLRHMQAQPEQFLDSFENSAEGHPAHNKIEIVPWNTENIINFSGGHSSDVTKQNLTGVFLSAVADKLIRADLAAQYIGARNAAFELELATDVELNKKLDGAKAVSLPDRDGNQVGELSDVLARLLEDQGSQGEMPPIQHLLRPPHNPQRHDAPRAG